MRIEERILLTGLSDAEILRLAAANGVGTLGLRVMDSAELADAMLMSRGISVPERVIGLSEAAAAAAGLLRESGYFRYPCSSDALMLVNSLDRLRQHIPDREEENLERVLTGSVFEERGRALLSLYRGYVETLREMGAIDRIMLIRRAIELGGPLDCKVLCLSDTPPTPLERRLLETAAGGRAEEISLCGLLGREEKGIAVGDMTEAYGKENEAEAVIGRILEDGLPLDSCTLAIADPALIQLLYDLKLRFGIPITFGCGIPVGNTLPARLLGCYGTWFGSGLQGKDALTGLIRSEGFNTSKLEKKLGITEDKSLTNLIAAAGALRLGPDRDINEARLKDFRKTDPDKRIAELIEGLSQELSQGVIYLIKNYSLTLGPGDAAARELICREIETALQIDGETDLLDLIDAVLAKRVLFDSPQPGRIFVTDLDQAISGLRKNLFIMGLSADCFPGSPAEDPLVTDGELMAASPCPEEAMTSSGRIRRKLFCLERLLITATALDNSIHLSYSGYNTAELKEANASSVLFELFGEDFARRSDRAPTYSDFEKAFAHAGYFDRLLSPSALVGRAFCEDALCSALDRSAFEEEVSVSRREFSPTEILEYIKCPMKFYYLTVMKMKEPDPDDPSEFISSADLGILIHKLMELHGAQKFSREAFERTAGEIFGDYLKRRPPVDQEELGMQRRTFMDIAGVAYDTDPLTIADDREVIMAEKRLSAVYMTKAGIELTVSGIPDRVEKLRESGALVVADFKTGRRIKHTKDDPLSCMQVLLYAYMLEKLGKTVQKGEYRYVRSGNLISCSYDAKNRDAMLRLLDSIGEDLKNGRFFCNVTSDCKYCGFFGICTHLKERGMTT